MNHSDGTQKDTQLIEGNDACNVKSILIYDTFILNRMAYMKMDPRIIRNGNIFLIVVVMLIGIDHDFCESSL